MSAVNSNIPFTEICINGKIIPNSEEENVRTCRIYEKERKYLISFIMTNTISLEVNIEKSLAEYNYSKWSLQLQTGHIMDFRLTLTSIPAWLERYVSSTAGCRHRITVTLKIEDKTEKYINFTNNLRSILSTTTCRRMNSDESIALWNKRCLPITARVLMGIDFRLPHFQSFTFSDVDRLRNPTQWLSDSHIVFSLWDAYREFSNQNHFGNMKVQLLDTHFWSLFSKDPERYVERTRTKLDILEYDYIVMPMFGSDHWRLGIIERPGEFLKGNMVFNILDSLPNNYPGKNEARDLQYIFLEHYEGIEFDESRIKINVARVPLQPNSYDCGCFLIYFAKKFFSHPHLTLALMKIQFASNEERIAGWGLKNSDLSFVRRQIRTRLLEYIKRGDAELRYQ